MLPPLPQRNKVEPKGWFEEKVLLFNDLLERAALSKRAWWKSISLGGIKLICQTTLYFGRTVPYVFRPWMWFSKIVYFAIQRHVRSTQRETARTLFLKRVFSSDRTSKTKFRLSYSLINWATIFVATFVVLPLCIECIYAYSTYGVYKNVVVTQAYRNITNVNTFAIHGYEILPNGHKERLYFGIGPNIWYWDLYPEFLFGQVTQFSKCDFTTYGITLRIPTRLHFLSEGALYVLNPWIISMQCTSPTIVP